VEETQIKRKHLNVGPPPSAVFRSQKVIERRMTAEGGGPTFMRLTEKLP
jgi:hypothetical protein